MEKYRIHVNLNQERTHSTKEWTLTARAIFKQYKDFFYWLFRRPFKLSQAIEQFSRCLTEGFLTIVIGSLVMGMFVAWVGGYFGKQYGAITYIGPIATLGIIHEFTLLLVGLLYACRVGTAFTVEIGSMAMSGQIDALRMMAIEPVQYIVIPRILASVASVLFLLGIANGIALVSTTLFLQWWFGLPASVIIDNAFMFLHPKMISQSFFRISIMGFFVALNACAVGFYFVGGATELGKVTTRSIVINFIYVLIIDLLTGILLTFTGWFTDSL